MSLIFVGHLDAQKFRRGTHPPASPRYALELPRCARVPRDNLGSCDRSHVGRIGGTQGGGGGENAGERSPGRRTRYPAAGRPFARRQLGSHTSPVGSTPTTVATHSHRPRTVASRASAARPSNTEVRPPNWAKGALPCKSRAPGRCRAPAARTASGRASRTGPGRRTGYPAAGWIRGEHRAILKTSSCRPCASSCYLPVELVCKAAVTGCTAP